MTLLKTWMKFVMIRALDVIHLSSLFSSLMHWVISWCFHVKCLLIITLGKRWNSWPYLVIYSLIIQFLGVQIWWFPSYSLNNLIFLKFGLWRYALHLVHHWLREFLTILFLTSLTQTQFHPLFLKPWILRLADLQEASVIFAKCVCSLVSILQTLEYMVCPLYFRERTIAWSFWFWSWFRAPVRMRKDLLQASHAWLLPQSIHQLLQLHCLAL